MLSLYSGLLSLTLIQTMLPSYLSMSLFIPLCTCSDDLLPALTTVSLVLVVVGFLSESDYILVTKILLLNQLKTGFTPFVWSAKSQRTQ